MFGAKIRRAGFWTLDSVKGGPVRRHYDDITDKMNEKKIL